MYKTEEERLAALRASRNKYQKTRTWYCDICNNGKNYLMTNKPQHLRTKKHQMNLIIKSQMKTIQDKSFVNDLISI